uniref:YnaH n=1 Tax=Bacillus subtilis TaxID=1423 RepID=P94486_BACIU|nr:YnaH [Bacillus subtilis]
MPILVLVFLNSCSCKSTIWYPCSSITFFSFSHFSSKKIKGIRRSISSGEKSNPVTFSRPKDPYNNGIMSNSYIKRFSYIDKFIINFILHPHYLVINY